MNKFQPQGKTKVVKGSVLNPENAGLCFILNVSNLSGKVEGAMHTLFDKKWRRVREETKGAWATKTGAFKLGTVNTITVQSNAWVVNMLCQDDKMQTDLSALKECLKKTCEMAKYEKATLHVSELLVKEIPEITDMLNKQLVENGVSVYYYQE